MSNDLEHKIIIDPKESMSFLGRIFHLPTLSRPRNIGKSLPKGDLILLILIQHLCEPSLSIKIRS